jgi:hypothetical protein
MPPAGPPARRGDIRVEGRYGVSEPTDPVAIALFCGSARVGAHGETWALMSCPIGACWKATPALEDYVARLQQNRPAAWLASLEGGARVGGWGHGGDHGAAPGLHRCEAVPVLKHPQELQGDRPDQGLHRCEAVPVLKRSRPHALPRRGSVCIAAKRCSCWSSGRSRTVPPFPQSLRRRTATPALEPPVVECWLEIAAKGSASPRDDARVGAPAAAPGSPAGRTVCIAAKRRLCWSCLQIASTRPAGDRLHRCEAVPVLETEIPRLLRRPPVHVCAAARRCLRRSCASMSRPITLSWSASPEGDACVGVTNGPARSSGLRRGLHRCGAVPALELVHLRSGQHRDLRLHRCEAVLVLEPCRVDEPEDRATGSASLRSGARVGAQRRCRDTR